MRVCDADVVCLLLTPFAARTPHILCACCVEGHGQQEGESMRCKSGENMMPSLWLSC